MRSSKKRINLKFKKELFADFHQVLGDLKDKDKAEKFLASFLTNAELLAFAKRLRVAVMLENQTPYGEIKKKLGVSSATIATVQEAMKKKPEGFILALKNLQAEVWANKTVKQISNFLKI